MIHVGSDNAEFPWNTPCIPSLLPLCNTSSTLLCTAVGLDLVHLGTLHRVLWSDGSGSGRGVPQSVACAWAAQCCKQTNKPFQDWDLCKLVFLGVYSEKVRRYSFSASQSSLRFRPSCPSGLLQFQNKFCDISFLQVAVVTSHLQWHLLSSDPRTSCWICGHLVRYLVKSADICSDFPDIWSGVLLSKNLLHHHQWIL